MSRGSKEARGGCDDRLPQPLTTLKAIVDDYIREWQPRCWVAFHEQYRAPSKALDVVATWRDTRGRMYSHQCCVLNIAKDAASMAIRKLQVGDVRDFEDLFGLVDRAIGNIPGIGDLAVYDVATRLGASPGKLPSKRVYLQSGALKGARALRLDSGKRSLPVEEFPSELHRLAVWEIEDLLCIYKRELRALDREGRAAAERPGRSDVSAPGVPATPNRVAPCQGTGPLAQLEDVISRATRRPRPVSHAPVSRGSGRPDTGAFPCSLPGAENRGRIGPSSHPPKRWVSIPAVRSWSTRSTRLDAKGVARGSRSSTRDFEP